MNKKLITGIAFITLAVIAANALTTNPQDYYYNGNCFSDEEGLESGQEPGNMD